MGAESSLSILLLAWLKVSQFHPRLRLFLDEHILKFSIVLSDPFAYRIFRPPAV